MYVRAGCISRAEFACTFVQVAYQELSLHVRLFRLHIYSYFCMYIRAGCISRAEFACTFVKFAYLQLSLHVRLCRLHINS